MGKWRTLTDLTGQKINKWTVIEHCGEHIQKNKAFWICRCECGTVRKVRACNLLTKSSKSCGCITKTKEWKLLHGPKNLKHGMSGTKEYKAWRAMLNRCYNKNVESYPRYGGRGISVCEDWRKSFEPFFKEVGLCPVGKSSIGRKNSDGNYEPGNVSWEDIVEQNNNKSDTRKFFMLGQTLSISKWCQKLSLNKNAVYARLQSGWTEEKALTTPIRRKSKCLQKIITACLGVQM